jgi:hypothetical protein
VIFFLFVLVLPNLFLGTGIAGAFWRSAWPLAVLLVLILLGMNGFYLLNYRLFYLLEREDWPALVLYLEDRVIKRGHYSSLLVRLLVNAYLVLSDYQAVMNLETKMAIAKPRLVDANALTFGIARILGKDYAEAAWFFEEKARKSKRGTAAWVRWYAGFSLLLNRKGDQAADRFTEIAGEEGNPVLAGLSSYFLAENLTRMLPLRSQGLMTTAMDGRKRVCAALPDQDAWNKEVEKIRSEVYGMILSKYFDETSNWLYSGKENMT